MASGGNSLEESIGMITAMNEIVQDPQVVGTAMKTISMRLRNTSGELQKMGIDAEGSFESVTKLQQEIYKLSGVDIMKDKNTFKSTYQIMTDLSKVWNNLTDVQQAQLTKMIAGVHQGNKFSALMKNMAQAANATDTAMHSQGSALKENTKYLDSIEGKISILKASFETLSNTTINGDFAKGAITGLTKVLDLVNSISGVTGTLPLLGALGFGKLNSMKRNINGGKGYGSGFMALRENAQNVGWRTAVMSTINKQSKLNIQNDVNQLNQLNKALSKISSSEDIASINMSQYTENMKDASSVEKAYIMQQNAMKSGVENASKAFNKNAEEIDNHKQALTKANSIGGKFANSLKGFGANLASGLAFGAAMFAIEKIIGFAADKIDKSIHAREYAQEDLDNAQSELSSLQQQYTQNQSQIDELVSRSGSLTAQEQATLATLKQQNAELERQIGLKEQDVKTKGYKVSAEASKDFSSDYSLTEGIAVMSTVKSNKTNTRYRTLNGKGTPQEAAKIAADNYQIATKMYYEAQGQMLKEQHELQLQKEAATKSAKTSKEASKISQQYDDRIEAVRQKYSSQMAEYDTYTQSYSDLRAELLQYQSQLDPIFDRDKIKAVEEALRILQSGGNSAEKIASSMEQAFQTDVSSLISGQEAYTAQVEKAVSAQNKLKDIGKMAPDYNFNFMADNAADFDKQIQNALGLLDQFKGADGIINWDLEGAQELRTILDTLFVSKQKFNKLDIDTTNASTKDKSYIDNLQNLQQATEYWRYLANDIHAPAEEIEAAGEKVKSLMAILNSTGFADSELAKQLSEGFGVDFTDFDNWTDQAKILSTLMGDLNNFTIGDDGTITVHFTADKTDWTRMGKDTPEWLRKDFKLDFIEADGGIATEFNKLQPQLNDFVENYQTLQKLRAQGSKADSSEMVSAMQALNTSYTDLVNNVKNNKDAQEILLSLGIDVNKGGLPDFIDQLFNNGVDHIDVDGTIHWKNDIEKLPTEEEKQNKINRVNRARNAVNSLKSQGKMPAGYNFNFQSTNIQEINDQIVSAQQAFRNFFNEKGQLNLTMKGADQVQAIMLALMKQKQELEKPSFLKVDMSNATTEAQNLQNRLNHLYDLMGQKQLIELGFETGNLDEINSEIDAVISNLVNNNKQALISVGIDLDSSPEEIWNQIKQLESEGKLEITTDVKTGNVKIEPVTQEEIKSALPEGGATVPVKVEPESGDFTVNVGYNVDTATLESATANRNMRVSITYVPTNFPGFGVNQVDGTAHAQGTAFARGNWGTKSSGNALGGELGQELVVDIRATLCFAA